MKPYSLSFTALAQAFAADALPALEECARGEIAAMLQEAGSGHEELADGFMHVIEWRDRTFLAMPDGDGGVLIDTCTFEEMDLDGRKLMMPVPDSDR